MSKTIEILAVARTEEEVRFLLRNYGMFGHGQVKEFTGWVLFPVTNYLTFYPGLDGRSVIIKENAKVMRNEGDLLREVGKILMASSSDFKKVEIPEHQRFGVTPQGFWAVPDKNHDYYRFELRRRFPVTILGRPITDIYLVGEHNNLRLVRRYIRRAFEEKGNLDAADIRAIKKRMCNYKLDLVIRFSNGRVLHLNKGEVINSKTTTKMPSAICVLLQDRKEFTHNVPMEIIPYVDSLEVTMKRDIDL